MIFLCFYAEHFEHFHFDFLVPVGEDEGRNYSIEQGKIENDERRPAVKMEVEKLVNSSENEERRPTEDDSSKGDDVDLGSFTLFSVDKLSSIGYSASDMPKIFFENERVCR